MELRWTQEAAADLERIADYLFEHTPVHAERLVRALYEAPATLLMFPNRGRLGKKEGTRELVMSPLPTSWSTRCAGTRSTSSASYTGRSSGRDRTTSPAGAIGCKAPRHRWHSRQRRQCSICNLQNPKGRVGFESHPLRQLHLRHPDFGRYLSERTLAGKPDRRRKLNGRTL
jgi:toxin ParE1/3/4